MGTRVLEYPGFSTVDVGDLAYQSFLDLIGVLGKKWKNIWLGSSQRIITPPRRNHRSVPSLQWQIQDFSDRGHQLLSFGRKPIITTCKRNLQRLCFYMCLSFCPQGGICLSACLENPHVWAWRPHLDVGLETPPGQTPQLPPIWAWRAPKSQTPQAPPWMCNWKPARHAGIYPPSPETCCKAC